MQSRVFPPVDGSVTLPETIDYHIKYNTYTPVYIFSEDGKSDTTKISYLEFGRAADRVAQCVRPDRNGPDGQVVAVVALSDTLLYQAVVVGILRAGLIPYPMSPRNTGAAIIKLMTDTCCHRLLTTQETLLPLIDDIKSELLQSDAEYPLSIEEMPPFLEIFPKLGQEKLEDPFKPYPAGVRPPLDNVMLYLHSSGSTGLPRTVPQTFRSMVQWAAFPSTSDHKKFGSTMAAMALPPFHTLGVIVQLLIAHYSVTTIGLYPPIATTPKSQPVMPTPGNILDHVTRTGCNGLITLPTFLQIWSQDKDAVRFLANLKYVAYSGGSLPSKLGDFLIESGIYLTQIYGATEFGAPTSFFCREGDEKDWEYDEFSDLANIHWDPQDDGTFECQFLTSDKHYLAVENLPNTRGYATSDLWVPHPTKPYLWKIVGRKDDVIIHTSGEKTVPAPMENVLMSSPYIMGAVMFGRERDQAGVLIELKPEYSIDPKVKENLINTRNSLWPVVEDANKVAPAFSRIYKEMILIVSPNKPLPRAGKGTIRRKAALLEYAEEIDAIYAEVDATVESEGIDHPSSWDFENTVTWLQQQVQDIQSGHPFSISGDLFDQGMDSLGATILRRRIVNALKVEKTQRASQLVTQTTIYTYPTIEKLSAFLVGVIADPDSFVLTSNKTDAIESMISKYSTGLSEPISAEPAVEPASDGAVILLTGSTGNLGAQLLESLLRDPRVKTVYTLDRPSSGTKSLNDRQAERFTDKAFDVNLLKSSRLIALQGEASQKNLGLDPASYEELRNSVTTIIHNAWRLDFNLSLSSFEPNVKGMRNLIDLARSTPHAADVKFLFTSSISSTFSWDKSRGPYPEDVVTDPRYAVGIGYGESKYVSERILAQSGIQATSFRIGQITGGSPNGAWATSDWVPIFVKSSIGLGVLPDTIGVVSWLPMHAVSQAILDVAWSTERAPPALNLVHPRPISWNSVVSSINEAMVEEGVLATKMPTVNYREWFSLLEKNSSNPTEDDFKNIPAIKLLEFFRANASMDETLRQQGVEDTETGGWATFATEKTSSISKTIETLPLLGKADALLWVKYWKNVGFF